jgi:hypothetical protein
MAFVIINIVFRIFQNTLYLIQLIPLGDFSGYLKKQVLYKAVFKGCFFILGILILCKQL